MSQGLSQDEFFAVFSLLSQTNEITHVDARSRSPPPGNSVMHREGSPKAAEEAWGGVVAAKPAEGPEGVVGGPGCTGVRMGLAGEAFSNVSVLLKKGDGDAAVGAGVCVGVG